MDLEGVVQNEVSQKEKKNHLILLICAIEKNGTGKLICKATFFGQGSESVLFATIQLMKVVIDNTQMNLAMFQSNYKHRQDWI